MNDQVLSCVQRVAGSVLHAVGAALNGCGVGLGVLQRGVRVEDGRPGGSVVADAGGHQVVRGVTQLEVGRVDRRRVHRLVEGGGNVAYR